MKKSILLFLFISLALISTALAQKRNGINWKNWQELETALAENPKPIFLFFEAEWCAYCKKIERVVFTKPEVIKEINNNYYALKMDVETKDSIYFDGLLFTNKQAKTQRRGVHDLPLLLASRKNQPFSLPASLFLDKNFRVQKRVFEYYTSKDLMELL